MTISSSLRIVSFHRLCLIILVLGAMLLNSCVTSKNITYLQEYKDSEYSGDYTPPHDYLIQPNDNLFISISTPDPRLSAIFNMGGDAGIMTANEASAQLMSYPVQLDGSIELPYIGTVIVAGKTIPQAKVIVESVLVDYVTDAAITVKLINNIVTVLGEVRIPGMYPIYKDRLNIFQALALAGDIDDYGDRYSISIVRQTLDGTIVKKFDITDRNIIDSEFYYILPNDVIYVKPIKGKFFGMTNYPYGFILTTVTAAVSLFLLIQNQILIQQQ